MVLDLEQPSCASYRNNGGGERNSKQPGVATDDAGWSGGVWRGLVGAAGHFSGVVWRFYRAGCGLVGSYRGFSGDRGRSEETAG